MRVIDAGRKAVHVVKRVVAPQKISARGAAFIRREEGFRSCLYNDPAGHCTIGVGHLVHLGGCTAADHRKWSCLTPAQADALLMRDAGVYERAVRKAVRIPLKQNEFDALVSFAYNVGAGGMASSSAVRALSAGNRAAVPSLLMNWSFAGGKPILHGRRTREGNLFAHGSYIG